ncbi:MAG: transposase [Chloroflexota bacterium]|nr:transposase [Chloroflexota bacterium]
MARIPTEVTRGQFTRYILPHLSTAQRGYISDLPLYKIFNLILYKLYTGCPWPAVPIEKDHEGRPVMSYQVPYYHFRKWSKDGSLQRLFDASIITIKGDLNLSELNLDGSHSAAKKGAKKSPIKAARRPRRAISCQ